MQAGMEACPVKTVMAGTMGFGLGGAFGLFMASVSYQIMFGGIHRLITISE
jgi:import inner membrane translocase subunit TIM22